MIFHWGIEFEDYPNPFQKELSDYLVKKFKNISIIGSHPHCIQGIYNNTFFSQGHFCMFIPEFTYPKKSKNGYILIQEYIKNKRKDKIYPYKINEKERQIILLEGKERREILDRLYKISIPLNMNNKEYLNFFKNNCLRNYPILTSNLLLNYIKMAHYRFIESFVQHIKPFFLFIFGGKIPPLFRRSIYKNRDDL